jgi:hypothetical protein
MYLLQWSIESKDVKLAIMQPTQSSLMIKEPSFLCHVHIPVHVQIRMAQSG